jgi:hypothetical protein
MNYIKYFIIATKTLKLQIPLKTDFISFVSFSAFVI